MAQSFDVIVIGGGQSGLAVGYYLRRSGLTFLILDKNERSGGSWQHHWKSLRLFSPAQWSSLPGVIMKGGGNYYPTREETVQYISDYEQRYGLPVKRPVWVKSVYHSGDRFKLETTDGLFTAKAVVSATGSFDIPVLPHYSGKEVFQGMVIHSSQYMSPDLFKDKRVAVVGEGNSGAQILAEVSRVADTIWITQKKPRFLPDHIDGRYLFDAASQMYEAKKQGKTYTPPSLGDVVMVSSVKEARERGILNNSLRPFARFVENGLVWEDGHHESIDAIIFCTGFQPSLNHLQGLGVITPDGRVETDETKSNKLPGLWLVGYGNWTGFASATLIGVGRSAKHTVEQVHQHLAKRISTPIK